MSDADRSADAIAHEIIERTGGDIRLALPLGLGKPVTLVNALTRAVADRSDTRLSILTALTLERPDMSEGMAQRFLEPAADRLFGRYPPLAYADMLRDGTLPDNIEVSEFFMQAGRWIGVRDAQRHYIPANYTHAYDVLANWRPNVLMQLLAPLDNANYSLSCNTDISSDLLRARREGRQDFLIVGEITDEFDEDTDHPIRKSEDGQFLIEGAMTIRDLNRATDWSLPDDEANTVAGLVIHEAQMIPTVGQVFSFHGFRFEVTGREANRITDLKIRPL